MCTALITATANGITNAPTPALSRVVARRTLGLHNVHRAAIGQSLGRPSHLPTAPRGIALLRQHSVGTTTAHPTLHTHTHASAQHNTHTTHTQHQPVAGEDEWTCQAHDEGGPPQVRGQPTHLIPRCLVQLGLRPHHPHPHPHPRSKRPLGLVGPVHGLGVTPTCARMQVMYGGACDEDTVGVVGCIGGPWLSRGLHTQKNTESETRKGWITTPTGRTTASTHARVRVRVVVVVVVVVRTTW